MMTNKCSISLLLLICVLYIIGQQNNAYVNAYSMDERVEVYHVRAPLTNTQQYGLLLNDVVVLHSGLHFHTVHSNEDYTVEYVSSPSLMTALFPLVIVNTQDIIWNAKGIVQTTQQFNTSYWSAAQLHVMTIDGYTLERYLCWTGYYNDTNPYYNPYQVVDSSTNTASLDSSISDDFTWASFRTLYNLGAQMTANITAGVDTPMRGRVSLFATTKAVLIDDPQEEATWDLLMTFFEKVTFMPNKTAVQLIQDASKLFNGVFYYYHTNQYWNMTLVQDRAQITFTQLATPMPSGDRYPSNVNYPQHCIDRYPQQHHSIGGGWIFIIILLSVVTAYIVGGLLVNITMRGKKCGLTALPNYDSWCRFGSMVSRACGSMSVYSGRGVGASDDGYNPLTVPSLDEEL
ncbi:hypothetical protein SAMD00019534_036900, partial [Acytostelium subglobosum LB1]|uniref:hypothetical protein n=1 Tax=Acytostelium subglobosum LB1 TaxID=1410327 RepID=UPI000644A30A